MRIRVPLAWVGSCVLMVIASVAEAVPPTATTSNSDYKPQVAAASDEGQKAIQRFTVEPGLKLELYAAEPLLSNPVAFCIDEVGKIYVAETFRLHYGVTDNRRHMNWLKDDLAAQTVEDRVEMYRKFLGKDFDSYGREHDRVKLVEDRDGDGQADHASVFADGFYHHADGIGSGVLARKGDVYFTCIPDLWLLKDTDGDGKADVKKSLHTGYGVHVAFLGHDLHGLKIGPDGRLYFSIGDRGLNVKTAAGQLTMLEKGCVLRCELDGSKLEIVHTGLRNPQELAFDEYGNLFSVDNNSDSGDKARFVEIVSGADSGWRIGYQYLQKPMSRGPWNAEKLWYPAFDGQAAYILPPIENISDGPSGFVYDPGTGLPEKYRRHFFLADFRGSSGNSGVRAFTAQAEGAGWKLGTSSFLVKGVLATDCDIGPDGKMYISDWTEGWGLSGKGRIYTLFDPASIAQPTVQETKQWIATDLVKLPTRELIPLLSHVDLRVRQEAQFALVAQKAEAELASVAAQGKDTLARLHAIWGLGQLHRLEGKGPPALVPFFTDADPQVRCAAIKTLGELWSTSCFDALFARLVDPQETPRVKFCAALQIGKAKNPQAIPALVDLLTANADRDRYLRHAAIVGLAECGDVPALVAAASNASPSARLGIVVALRKLASPEVARFLGDEPLIAVEAARAIYDTPIRQCYPQLAATLAQGPKDAPFALRAIAANYALRDAQYAAAVATYAATENVPESLRVAALETLAEWAEPSGLDLVVGLWRPLESRSVGIASEAAQPVIASILATAPNKVRTAAAELAGSIGLSEASPALAAIVSEAKRPAEVRNAALEALGKLKAESLPTLVQATLHDASPKLRATSQRLLASLDPAQAIGVLDQVLQSGSTTEQQAAIATLATMKQAPADRLLVKLASELVAGKAAPEIQLDILAAAKQRSTPELAQQVAKYEAALGDDPLAKHRVSLVGGDVERGRKIFLDKTEVACLRCHRVEGKGGEVGPDLTGIAARSPREYLLEAIVTPDKKIAPGFETVILELFDGRSIVGVLRGETKTELTIYLPDGKKIFVPVDDVETRTRGPSSMPANILQNLSPQELRDLVEFLASLKTPLPAP